MQFSSIFSPSSIALVGASAKPGSVGNNLMKNLVQNGFGGTIYAVNPTPQVIEGIQSVPSLTAIGKPIDLAIIAVKADIVLSVVEEAGKCGVKGLIIISAGFREAGPEGKDREKKLQELCSRYEITMVGPNCLGIIRPSVGINASFAPLMPKKGTIAFISQSGALGAAVVDFARDLDIGFSSFVSLGNKAAVDEVSLLSYFADDPETKVILLYLEDIRDASGFIAAAKAVTHGKNAKPILFLKAGRTQAGATASVSHTGALGGNDAYYSALALQSGAIRVATIQELFSDALMFAHNQFPHGNRVSVITNAGGPGVLMTDEAVISGLSMASLGEKTVQALKEQLPMCANCLNPIDVLGDAKSDRYDVAFQAIAKDPNVDSILILLTPQAGTEPTKTAERIIALKKNTDKPIGVSFIGGPLVFEAMQLLRRENVAAFSYPEDAAKAMATLSRFSMQREEQVAHADSMSSDVQPEKVTEILSSYGKGTREVIPEAQAHEVLKFYGLPVLRSEFVREQSALPEAIARIGTAVAMKIVSPDITHKSDVGGVILHVSPDTVLEAYTKLMETVAKRAPQAKLEGVLLVEMAESGMEIIVGAQRQAGFGTMVMVGLGGIYVEAFKDVAFGVAPITQQEAKTMIERLKIYTILQGIRGKPAMDIALLADCLTRVSRLVTDHPEIVELDINPFSLATNGTGGRVLDARIVVERV